MRYSQGHVWLINNYNVMFRYKNDEFSHVKGKAMTLWVGKDLLSFYRACTMLP